VSLKDVQLASPHAHLGLPARVGYNRVAECPSLINRVKTMKVTLRSGSSRSFAQKPRIKPGFCLTPFTRSGRAWLCLERIASSLIQVPATANTIPPWYLMI
jgi:hypothetical protein